MISRHKRPAWHRHRETLWIVGARAVLFDGFVLISIGGELFYSLVFAASRVYSPHAERLCPDGLVTMNAFRVCCGYAFVCFCACLTALSEELLEILFLD